MVATDLEQQGQHATHECQQQHDVWWLLVRCMGIPFVLFSVYWLAGIP